MLETILQVKLSFSGNFPRIRRKPTVKVTAQYHRLVFNCSLSEDVLDPKGVYEITWYNGDKRINKTDTLLNGSKTSLVMNENMFQSLYQLGVEVTNTVHHKSKQKIKTLNKARYIHSLTNLI